MSKKEKNECNNQWASGINSLTSKTGVEQKDATNNQWASTLKKDPEVYSGNCNPKKQNK